MKSSTARNKPFIVQKMALPSVALPFKHRHLGTRCPKEQTSARWVATAGEVKVYFIAV